MTEVTTVPADAWDAALERSPHASFLQSSVWGEFQETLGYNVHKLWVPEGPSAGFALVIVRELPGGLRWLYAPRGPVVITPGTYKQGIWKALTELAQAERAVFLKVEPTDTDLVDESGWQQGRSVQPQHTLVLDLSLSPEQLLAGFHSKTRYNIRVAERHDVKVRFSSDVRDVDVFLALAREVTERTAFHYHPPEYFRKLIGVLGPRDLAEFAIAEFDGAPVAAHLMIYNGTTVTYAHGASSSAARKVMGPQLLHWATLKRARERGALAYDFFGIAPPDAGSEHPWAGITRFKRGFGGRVVSYSGAYDFVSRPLLYWTYLLGRRLRRG